MGAVSCPGSWLSCCEAICEDLLSCLTQRQYWPQGAVYRNTDSFSHFPKPIYRNTLRTTENNVVPISSQVWHCKFTL